MVSGRLEEVLKLRGWVVLYALSDRLRIRKRARTRGGGNAMNRAGEQDSGEDGGEHDGRRDRVGAGDDYELRES